MRDIYGGLIKIKVWLKLYFANFDFSNFVDVRFCQCSSFFYKEKTDDSNGKTIKHSKHATE